LNSIVETTLIYELQQSNDISLLVLFSESYSYEVETNYLVFSSTIPRLEGLSRKRTVPWPHHNIVPASMAVRTRYLWN